MDYDFQKYAQSAHDIHNYAQPDVTSSGATGIILALIFYLLIVLPIGIFMLMSIWRLFTKAGRPGWASLIPIYNIYTMIEIAGKPGWWLFLFFIPIVNVVIAVLILMGIANNFGKKNSFVIGMIFLPYVFYPILAFGKAKYSLGDNQVLETETTGTVDDDTAEEVGKDKDLFQQLQTSLKDSKTINNGIDKVGSKTKKLLHKVETLLADSEEKESNTKTLDKVKILFQKIQKFELLDTLATSHILSTAIGVLLLVALFSFPIYYTSRPRSMSIDAYQTFWGFISIILTFALLTLPVLREINFTRKYEKYFLAGGILATVLTSFYMFLFNWVLVRRISERYSYSGPKEWVLGISILLLIYAASLMLTLSFKIKWLRDRFVFTYRRIFITLISFTILIWAFYVLLCLF